MRVVENQACSHNPIGGKQKKVKDVDRLFMRGITKNVKTNPLNGMENAQDQHEIDPEYWT